MTPHRNLDQSLLAVWRRSQRLHLVAGLLAFCRWSVALFLISVLIDWLTRMPAGGRVAMFIVLLVTALYRAWTCGWKELRAFNATHVALEIEEQVGQLESLLVSAVQLRDLEPPDELSRSMIADTCSQAETASAALQPVEIVGFGPLRRPLLAAAGMIAIIAIFALLNGPFLTAGLARIFPPWAAIDYPTRTQLELVGGDLIVKEGEAALIQARISGVVPKHAKLALRTGSGKPRIHKLPVQDGACEYGIDAAYRSFEYRLMAGDARSAWRRVDVIQSPRITAAVLSLDFPDYTQRPTKSVDGLTVTVPEKTRISWTLTLDHAVSEASCEVAGSEPEALQISPDGLTVTMERVATESRPYTFTWTEKAHGFTFTSPSNYLEVAPDLAPRVELTQPEENLYAMLGRKLELAFRVRDDHGIGEAVVAYRVNKLAEAQAPFTPSATAGGAEQSIDWDYRSALPNLAVGDSVTFVIEVADRYPGPGGEHRVRSQSRRLSFLSKKDYLAQIAKQKKRLLLELRTIYREERGVHATLLRDLDPSDAAFLQTCQLEAVRQDLMKERLLKLKARMDYLLADLAANNITDKAETATFVQLSADLQAIADKQLTHAAATLWEAAKADRPDTAPAIRAVDHVARELAVQILNLGYREASEIMARELHAIAETEAALRLQTILTAAAADTASLAAAQDELGRWLTRLTHSAPVGTETTVKDALVAFTLARLTKKLRKDGIDSGMREASALIAKGDFKQAPALQAKAIRALLEAEFRLRVGAEHDALVTAGELFDAQAAAHKQPQTENTQKALQAELHLLLMPAIPAPRPRLLEGQLPKPPVGDLLAAAEAAMAASADLIAAGEQDKAAIEQQAAEQAFADLADLVRKRRAALLERERVDGGARLSAAHGKEIRLHAEAQLLLLDQADEAAADGTNSLQIGRLQERLLESVRRSRNRFDSLNAAQLVPSRHVPALLDLLDRAIHQMESAVPTLKKNKPDDAIERQEQALDALDEATALLDWRAASAEILSAALTDAKNAQTPAPFVSDIRAEQLDLVTAYETAKPADLMRYAVVQKNLVHAVNAILDSLDTVSHHIETGTVMLFAKHDMDDAALALEANDLIEAADAGNYVAESLEDLLGKLKAVAPQYVYVLELTEFFNEIVDDGLLLQATQSRIRDLATREDADLAKLAAEERALLAKTTTLASRYYRVRGQPRFGPAAEFMTAAAGQLESGDRDAALDQMEEAEDALITETEGLLELVDNLSFLLAPLPEDYEVPPQITLLLDVVAVTSDQKALHRQTQASSAQKAQELAPQQLQVVDSLDPLITRVRALPKLSAEKAEQQARFDAAHQSVANLEAAKQQLTQAASSLSAAAHLTAVSSLAAADDSLSRFVLDYVMAYVVPIIPPGGDPVPSDKPIPGEEDLTTLFMPGQVSGRKPRGGRQEWQVLGSRDRLALNENFARELPLEFREILKTYYERLAK